VENKIQLLERLIKENKISLQEALILLEKNELNSSQVDLEKNSDLFKFNPWVSPYDKYNKYDFVVTCNTEYVPQNTSITFTI
jgi:hypothetical protein